MVRNAQAGALVQTPSEREPIGSVWTLSSAPRQQCNGRLPSASAVHAAPLLAERRASRHSASCPDLSSPDQFARRYQSCKGRRPSSSETIAALMPLGSTSSSAVVTARLLSCVREMTLAWSGVRDRDREFDSCGQRVSKLSGHAATSSRSLLMSMLSACSVQS
eukprot:238106-Prymnesium_polylepis.3